MGRILLIGGYQETVVLVAQLLAEEQCAIAVAAGRADALRRLRAKFFDVVVSDPVSSVDEDLAMLDEMRRIQPGINVIILSAHTAAEDVISALRARVFGFFSAPFDPAAIAAMALEASEGVGRNDIEVLSAEPGWVSLKVHCRLLTAERLITFINELRSDLPEPDRQQLMIAFREILLNAMEHGAGFNAEKVVEVVAARTARAVVFYIRDPGAGFRSSDIPHAAISNAPDDPIAHMEYREAQGMRPGGYGILVSRNVIDELIYNEFGNEVLLIKYFS
jgi:CheY-like chemotaxis protein/anti-sigma regulatory factor (Ser/Thr protein kinase)